jgi:hypothetical protein
MRIRPVLVGLSAVVLATIGVAGPAQASARHASTGPVQFALLSTDPSEHAQPLIIANGKIHARGTDIELSSNQSGTRGTDKFVFPRGSLFVSHHTTRGTSHDSFDRTTCLGTHTEDGTFNVTGGTNRYSDASGNGHYQLEVDFISCNPNATPRLFIERIQANGSLTD